jgi:hypothetical protein
MVSLPAVDALSDLVHALGTVAQTGGLMPREQRAELFDCVSELARELDRGLSMAIAYLQRAEASDGVKELGIQLRSGASRLDGTFREVGLNRRVSTLVARFDDLCQVLTNARAVWGDPRDPANDPAIAALIAAGWGELGAASDELVSLAGTKDESRAIRAARARIRSELIALEERKKEVAAAARSILQTI